MNVEQIFRTAVRNLLVNKMRSVQVMLSMVVAVAAVIVVCNTCRLMVQQVESSWTPESLSNTNMYIDSRVDLNKRPTIDDLQKIADANPDIILGVSPYVTDHTMTGNVRYGDKYYKEAYFIGVNEQYADMHLMNVADGRFIQYMDCRSEQNVCVLSGKTADELIGENAVGKTLSIWGFNYTVIGVLDDETEGLIYLPYTCADKIVGDRIQTGYQGDKYYVNRFEVKANGIDNISNVRQLVQEAMDKLLGSDKGNWSLNFTSYQFVKEEIIGYAVSQTYNYLLMALFVSLVGGVGIMNVMIASVQERTKEIGLRKAFGATENDIKRQFRLEAVITSLLGGLLGVAFGVILSFSVPWLVSDMTVGNTGMTYSTAWLDIGISAWPILLGLGLALLVGVVFGTYPAQQAAKMEPVAAINAD